MKISFKVGLIAVSLIVATLLTGCGTDGSSSSREVSVVGKWKAVYAVDQDGKKVNLSFGDGLTDQKPVIVNLVAPEQPASPDKPEAAAPDQPSDNLMLEFYKTTVWDFKEDGLLHLKLSEDFIAKCPQEFEDELINFTNGSWKKSGYGLNEEILYQITFPASSALGREMLELFGAVDNVIEMSLDKNDALFLKLDEGILYFKRI